MSRQSPLIGQLSSVLAIAFLMLAVAGCGGGEKDAPSPSGDPAAAQPSAAGLAVLAKADAADGATDKVVSKCLTCNLGMEGNSEHVATLGDYKLHLCSPECKSGFEAAPEKALLAYPASRFVVTCRYAGYTDAARLNEDFLELNLRPLSDEESAAFVGNSLITSTSRGTL